MRKGFDYEEYTHNITFIFNTNDCCLGQFRKKYCQCY